MATQIGDDTVTLETIKRVVATARLSQHAPGYVRVAQLVISAEKRPVDLLLR